MTHRLLLHGGLVVREEGTELADVLIDGMHIASIGRGLHGTVDAEVVDVSNHLVMPGAIDLHVHFEEPSTTQREGFRTGTMAAAAGGITSVVEHPLSDPPTTTQSRFVEKRDVVARNAFVDFALWGGAVPGNLGEIEGMVSEGAAGFKVFMVGSEPEYPRLDGPALAETMAEIARLGATIVVHAEDNDLVERETDRLRSEGRGDPAAWAESRPERSETLAVARALRLARQTRCRIQLVHLSVPDAVNLASAARREGVQVAIETCAHHLLLDELDMVRLGPWAKCAPPLRSRSVVEGLWDLVLDGTVDFLASDHAPWEPHEKTEGDDDIWLARNGVQSLQLMTILGLNAWERRGGALSDWVRLVSGRPARWLGIFPQKGSLRPGSDADVAVYAVQDERPVSRLELLNRHQWTPFEGMATRYQVVGTMLRGEWVFRDGAILGAPRGRFVPIASFPSDSAHVELGRGS